MKKGIIAMLSTILGAVAGTVVSGRVARKTVYITKQMSDKHLTLYLMMNRWVEVKQEGKNLADYFDRKGYKSVAIYGMNYVGERLLYELKNSDIEVRYGIDRRADEIYTDIDVITMDENFPDVDVIVVTPVYFYDEIRDRLTSLTNCPVVSLEDVLHEL